METLNDFLDAVAKETGNDNRTAKALGISNAHVGNWRGIRSIPSNRHVIEMCKIAKLDLEKAILAIENTREKKASKREVYRYAGATLSAAGFATTGMMIFLAAFGLIVTLIMTHPTLSAAPILQEAFTNSVYYVKLYASIYIKRCIAINMRLLMTLIILHFTLLLTSDIRDRNNRASNAGSVVILDIQSMQIST